MPISTVTLVNTFDEWRIRTNESITVLNNYLDDGVRDGTYTYRNLTANVVTSNTINSNTISSNTIFSNVAISLNINTLTLIANTITANSINTVNLVVNQINANSILLSSDNMNVEQAIRSSYVQANTARVHANGAFLTANAAFDAQNVTSAVANSGYDQANTARVHANGAFLTANAAFGQANIAATQAGVIANAAFGQANTARVHANGAFLTANAAFGAQNVTSDVANAAFNRGNTAVLKTGNTMTGNLVFSGSNITFLASVTDGSTLGRGFSNLGIFFSNTAGPGIESAIYANSANIIVFATKKLERVRIDDSGRLNVGTIDIVQFATAAYSTANAATVTGDGGLAVAIGAYIQANTTRTHANGAFLTANAAFDQANVAATQAGVVGNAAFAQANTTRTNANSGYDQANTARTHANGAFLTANAAFGQANTSGVQPGVIANAAFGQANTAATQAGVIANAAFDKANTSASASTIGSAAFDQANTARTHANGAFLTANAAFGVANSAFGSQNVTSAVANAAFDTANSKVLKTGDNMSGDLILSSATNQVYLKVTDGAIEITRGAGGAYIDFKDSTAEDVDIRLTYSSTNLQKILSGGATSTIWDSGNDGAGSGLDADLLDGQQGSYYAPISSPTFTGTVTIPTLSVTTSATIVSPTITGTSNTAGATVLSQTLSDGATVTWDIPKGQIATLTLAGSRTMAAPTNLKVGTYVLYVIQGGTGSYTITWNSVFKWTQGVAPTLSTSVGARDVFSFVCDGTNLYGAMIPDVR